MIIKTAKTSPVHLGNSGIIGDGFVLDVGLCRIVELGVGVAEGEVVGLEVGDEVGDNVGAGDVDARARVA